MKKLIISLLLAPFALSMLGQHRSYNEAKLLAEKIMSEKKEQHIAKKTKLTPAKLPIDSLYLYNSIKKLDAKTKLAKPSLQDSTIVYNKKALPKQGKTNLPILTLGEEPFYVFNDSTNKQFVIVAADERMTTLLGYSNQGVFDYSSIPDAMKNLLGQYASEYHFLQNTTECFSPKAKSGNIQPVAPLLSTNWGQDAPYNKKAPYIGIYRGVTGCVATAMAQIMYHHKYPTNGTGSHSYVSETEKLKLSQDFSSTFFDWSSMLDDYSGGYSTQEANSVATLMRSCGISVNMDYCYYSSGPSSGAYSCDVPYALRTHFGYNNNVVYYEKDYFSDEEWDQIIYEELSAGRPIYYSGSGYYGGHAFVLDGCDSDGLYHINWGWEGDCNGYFPLTALKPNYYYSFSSGQGMVCRISPELTGEDESVFYAKSFKPYKDEVLLNSVAEFQLRECYNYSNKTSSTRQEIEENWTISLSLYDEQFNFIKHLDSFDATLAGLWGYRYRLLQFVPANAGLEEGKTYYLAPTVQVTNDKKITRIRTEKGETDFYAFYISDGKLIIGEKIINEFEIDGINYSVLEDDRTCVEVKGVSSDAVITIPEIVVFEKKQYKVTAIGNDVFKDMTDLGHVQLPSTIERIGSDAFKGCVNLEHFFCDAKNPPVCGSWTSSPFEDVKSAYLYVPENCRGQYRKADGWNSFACIIEDNESFYELDEVTYQYVMNPDFDYIFDGWETTTGAINNQLNNNMTDGIFAMGNFWENWNSEKFSGKMYQKMSVPNGVYRLEMAAFTDASYGAYVYANSAMTEVVSANFDRIYSVNVLVTDGLLEIGLMMPDAIQSWVAIDNVKLYYTENISGSAVSEILAQQIKASFSVTYRNSMERSLLEELKSTITMAEEALYKDVDTEMRTVYEKLIDITHRAQESSAIYQRVREALDELEQEITVSKAAADVIEKAQKLHEQLWNAYIGGVWTTVIEINKAVDQLKQMIIEVRIPDFADASDDNPINMSSVIANHDLEQYNMDWIGSGGWLWNVIYHNVEFWNENFSYYQELKGLPNGMYKVSVQGFYRPGSHFAAGRYYDQDDRSKLHASLFADNGETIAQTYIQSIMQGGSETRIANSDVIEYGKYIPDDMAGAAAYFEDNKYTDNFLFVEVKDNKLTIGLYKDVYQAEDWMIFNKWTLHYYGKYSSHRHGECSGTYKLTCTGGSENIYMELCPGDTIVLPDNYTKYGHTFIGWDSSPIVMPARNLTVRAKFTPTIYALIYQNADGTELFRDSVAYDSPIVLRDYPNNNGGFKAWLYNGKEAPLRMPANDVVLIADIDTGIDEIFMNNKFVDVYTIDGVLLRRKLSVRELHKSLKEGVYIINGRKIYLKK